MLVALVQECRVHIEAAADELERSLKQNRRRASARTARYPAMEERLVKMLKALRAPDRGLSIRWLVMRACQVFADLYPGKAFMASLSWRRRFAARYKLTRLKKTHQAAKRRGAAADGACVSGTREASTAG